jgi:hypothetical protein
MESPTHTLSEEQSGEETATRAPGSTLTQAQKDATIQKWVDWILKQRAGAAQPKSPEGGTPARDDESGA